MRAMPLGWPTSEANRTRSIAETRVQYPRSYGGGKPTEPDEPYLGRRRGAIFRMGCARRPPRGRRRDKAMVKRSAAR